MAKRKKTINYSRFFPNTLTRLGLLFVIVGVFFLGVRYLELPYLHKSYVLSYIPLWSRNFVWVLILLGFFLQYLDTD